MLLKSFIEFNNIIMFKLVHYVNFVENFGTVDFFLFAFGFVIVRLFKSGSIAAHHAALSTIDGRFV